MRRLGSRVTVVRMGPWLVAREDEDVSAAIQAFLEAEGIEVVLNAKCQATAMMYEQALTALVRPEKLKLQAIGAFEAEAAKRSGFALSHVKLDMSETAMEARSNLTWDTAL